MDVDAVAALVGHGAAGRRLARQLWREGVRSLAALRRPDVLARLPRRAAAELRWRPRRRIPGAEALRVAAAIKQAARFDRPAEVVPVGSVRRGAPPHGDLDFLVVVPDRAALALDSLRFVGRGAPARLDAYASGPRNLSAVVRCAGRRYLCDFFLATAAEKPFALFHRTGPAAYNIRTRARARARGWRLNQYGLFVAGSRRRVRGSGAIRTEAELARFLGLTVRPPADRH